MKQLFLILLMFSMASCCQQRKQTQMKYFGCQVFTNNCQEFQMVECREKYCAKEETYYEQERYYDQYSKSYKYRTVTKTECVRYDYYYYDNDTCWDECCGEEIENELQVWNVETVQTCLKQNERLIEEKNQETGIIVGSIFGGIGLIFLIFGTCVLCKYCSRKSLYQKQQNNQNKNQNELKSSSEKKFPENNNKDPNKHNYGDNSDYRNDPSSGNNNENDYGMKTQEQVNRQYYS